MYMGWKHSMISRWKSSMAVVTPCEEETGGTVMSASSHRPVSFLSTLVGALSYHNAHLTLGLSVALTLTLALALTVTHILCPHQLVLSGLPKTSTRTYT